MSDPIETRAWTVATLYPWPRGNKTVPACSRHDPEMWFPENRADYEEAIKICGTCPLLDLCQELAHQRGESGVWGGSLFKAGRPLAGFPQPGRPKKDPAPTKTEAPETQSPAA